MDHSNDMMWPLASYRRGFAAEQNDYKIMHWFDRVLFKLWLARLTTLAWAVEYNTSTFQDNKDFIWNQPNVWLTFWVDGYTPEDALHEEATCG